MREKNTDKMKWLNRAWRISRELESCRAAKEKISRLDEKAAARRIKAVERQERKLASVSCQIINAINALPDSTDRQILTYRYICCLSHEQIAQAMGYREISSVYRRIRAAARKIEIK